MKEEGMFSNEKIWESWRSNLASASLEEIEQNAKNLLEKMEEKKDFRQDKYDRSECYLNFVAFLLRKNSGFDPAEQNRVASKLVGLFKDKTIKIQISDDAERQLKELEEMLIPSVKTPRTSPKCSNASFRSATPKSFQL